MTTFRNFRAHSSNLGTEQPERGAQRKNQKGRTLEQSTNERKWTMESTSHWGQQKMAEITSGTGRHGVVPCKCLVRLCNSCVMAAFHATTRRNNCSTNKLSDDNSATIAATIALRRGVAHFGQIVEHAQSGQQANQMANALYCIRESEKLLHQIDSTRLQAEHPMPLGMLDIGVPEEMASLIM